MGDRISGRPTPKQDATCADRVRSQYLAQVGPGEEPRVELLHEVACEIVGQCGHSAFKAHRIAWGWTIAEAVAAFHDMCRCEGIKPRGLVARSWMEWETGSRPSWDYQDLLSRLFRTNPVQLGWAADYAPGSTAGAMVRIPGAASPTSVPAERSGAILHLPPDTGDFTGRSEHVDMVVQIISAAAHRLYSSVPVASISGKPGVGKTTLAIHAAHMAKGAFPDGQMYANLHGAESRAADPSDVLAGFLRELGVDGIDVPEGLDERARMYRAQLARRRVLVVLDNAADESQVRPLLPGSRGCAVLVTSRTRMAALAGAHSVPLDVMSSKQATDLLTAIIGSERASAEPQALAEIAHHCGYLPLALRIAGARLLSRPAWQVSWFAARLRDETRRLDMLRAGDLEVRASFALSYQSRDAAEQRAFRMLGLINSDFPAWNLAALLSRDADHAEQLLEQLVDAELAEIFGVDAAGLIRYRLHDLLRDFAREAANDSEPAVVRREALCRLARQYADSAQLASGLLHPGDTDTSALSPIAKNIIQNDPWCWFTSERANLVAMVGQTHAAGLWEETWRLAESLSAMFEWRADWRSWENTHQLALDATRAAGDEQAEAIILRSLGSLYRELGRYDDAASLLKRASEIFDGLGDRPRWATSMRNLGDTYRYQGRLAQAINAFSAAFEVFESTLDRRSAAGALNGMADANRGLSRWSQAMRQFTACIGIYHDLDDQLEEARAKVRYALVFRDQCLSEQADPLITEALEVFRLLGDRRWEARALRHLGVLRRNDQDIDEALSLFEQCMTIFDELGDRRGAAVIFRNRGDARRLVDRFDEAGADLQKALAMFDDVADHRWAARTRLSIAGVHRRECEWLLARECATAALMTFREIGDRHAEARALRELGLTLRDQGEFGRSSEMLASSLAIFRALDDAVWSARVLASTARLASRRGEDAAPFLQEANETCSRAGISSPERIAVVLREW